jgi:hypothetical protein
MPRTTSLQDKLRELVAKWREFSHTYSGESWMGARKRAQFCADELEEILNDDYPPVTESLSRKVETLIEQASRPHEWGTCRDALDRLLCTYCANHVPNKEYISPGAAALHAAFHGIDVPLPKVRK